MSKPVSKSLSKSLWKASLKMALVLAVGGWGACAEIADETASSERRPLGKEDASGTCSGYCGEQSAGACWCDVGCMLIGDCCDDVMDVCSEVAPAPEALCADTGGVWSGGACDCSEGDPMSWMEFDPERGCNLVDDAELMDAALDGGAATMIERFADGPVWLVARPGAVDYVVRHDTPAALTEALTTPGWIAAFEDAGSCAGLERGGLPEVDCDVDTATAGCHLVSLPGHAPRMSAIMEMTNDIGLTTYSAGDLDAARAADDSVRAVFVDARLGVTFTFARSGGKWRLVYVDVARYDCSA